MRFLLSTLTIQFRPTLTYFNRRESIMGNYHPRNFKNWMRGDKHFVLINSDDRRAIRFEPNKLIVRVEGHNSADMFDEGVGFAYQMLDDFNIVDYFFVSCHVVQVKPKDNLKKTRVEFAQKFIHQNLHEIHEIDSNTDYSSSIERKERVDRDLKTIHSNKAGNSFLLEMFALFGPVIRKEIKERWLEFKEENKLEMYQTSPNIPKFGHVVEGKVTLTREKGTESIPFETVKNILIASKNHSEKLWSFL